MAQPCVPVLRGSDVTVLQKPALNFDGCSPEFDTLWYGRIAFKIASDDWTLDEFLSYGSEGQTYLARRQRDGQRFVAKFCLDKNSTEVELCKKIPPQLVSHPNFVTYEMIVMDVQRHFAPAHHMIIMENIPNGELFELLASDDSAAPGRPLNEGTTRRFLHDVIHGMAQCYRYGVTHRDLKPDNLLIDDRGNIVIIDLGHAKSRDPSSFAQASQDVLPQPLALQRLTTMNKYGTAGFVAPEAVLGKKYDCELSDVWSLGVIAFYLHAKLPAFIEADGVGSVEDIVGADNDPFWQKIHASGYYPFFPSALVQFINQLLRNSPKKRPSFNQLELAINGDTDTIAEFPGLQWLAKPVNDRQSFIDELRSCCPGKTFR
jgi:serine/threonine protein kinase